MNPFTKAMADTRTKPSSCDLHGPFIARAVAVFGEVWTSCPQCEAGRLERETEERQAEQLRSQRARWLAKLADSGIPKRFQDATLESYRAALPGQSAALQWANAFAANFEQAMETGRSALLVGRPGTGKTHLAAGIAMAVLQRGCSVAFTTVQRAIRRVKSSWQKESAESETEAIRAFAGVDLLILDEVGVQFGSQFEANLLFDILNERYENVRPTLLLSNLPLADVTKLLGDRIIDRFRESGGRVVVFDWESHRGTA